MRKNIAGQDVSFQMNATSDGAVVTTGTPTVYYTIDGGSQGTGGGASTHEGNGQWGYAPTQAETNGDHVAFTMILTNAIAQTVNTWPVAFDPSDATRLGILALPPAAADAAGGLVISDAGGLDVDNEANTAFFTSAAKLVDDVWDEPLTGGTHNVATSAGRRLRSIQDFGIYDMASVWVDESGGASSGTTNGEDATVTNRADDLDNAVTIAASVGLDKIHIQSGNSITLTGALNGYDVWGRLYTIALGGQSIAGTTFCWATISGIGTGSNPEFCYSTIGTVTLPPARFMYCSYTGTFTMSTAGAYRFIRGESGVAGANAPIWIKTSGQTITGEWRDYKGSITVTGLESGDVLTICGTLGTITLNGADASVEIRGTYKSIVNNLTGSPTVNLDGAILAADVATILEGLVLQVTTIATLASQTSFTLSAGSADDDAYGGATIIIVDASTGVQKAFGSISSYTGTSKTVTLAQDPGIFTMATSDKVYIVPSDVFAIWDRLLTGGTHNINNSAAKRAREASGKAIDSGTAQAGTVNTITLATGASSMDGAYDPSMIAIVVGTGMGQSRLIFQYDGTTKVAAVDRNWKVNPDNTSEYVIYANPGREHVNEGLAQAGATATITLNALASGTNDSYVGQIIFIRSGTGEDQARIVIAYNGTTKVATVQKDWYATPDNTSGYVMLPMQVETTDEIATAFYEHATAGHTAAGTFGKVFNDMLADTNEIQGKLPTNKFMGSSDGADDDGNIAAILADTNELQGNQGDWATATGFFASGTMTESYAADGDEATPEQALYQILSLVSQYSTSGTGLTSYKLDGTTPAMVYLLDDATDPTSRTRTS